MFYSAAIARKINDFGKARSGSFAIMMAMVLAVLALSAGFAVNLAQLYNVRSSLRQALDAAVTSTARDITTGKIEADDARAWVERFLKSPMATRPSWAATSSCSTASDHRQAPNGPSTATAMSMSISTSRFSAVPTNAA